MITLVAVVFHAHTHGHGPSTCDYTTSRPRRAVTGGGGEGGGGGSITHFRLHLSVYFSDYDESDTFGGESWANWLRCNARLAGNNWSHTLAGHLLVPHGDPGSGPAKI